MNEGLHIDDIFSVGDNWLSPLEDSMASTTVAVLEERVANHIKFFWVVVAFGFLWLGGLTTLMIQTKSAVKSVAKLEADTPAQIVSSLLSAPASTLVQTQSNLAAAASVLQTSKIGEVRPDTAKLKSISDKLIDDQTQYPQLPQVWQTTGAFINYKSQAMLISGGLDVADIESGKNCTNSVTDEAVTYKGCKISLEDVATHFVNFTKNGKHVPIVFVNCIVEYSGGNIPDAPVKLYASILRFQVPTVPPARAGYLMRELAQADSLNGFVSNG